MDLKKFNRAILAMCIFVMHSTVPAWAAPPGKDKDAAGGKPNGWLLLYRQPMVGRIEVKVSPWGSLIANPLFSFIVRVPDYKILIFNRETKKVVIFSREEALKRILLLANKTDEKFHYGKWRQIGKEKLNGFDTTKYQRDLLNPQGNAHIKTAYSEIQYVTDYKVFGGDTKTIKEILDPINKVMARGSVGGTGWVLQVTTLWKKWRDGKLVKDEPAEILEFIDMKRATFKKSEFDIDKQYTHVKDETEVMMSGMGGGMFQMERGN